MYIMCVILCLFSALSCRVGALQISIIIKYYEVEDQYCNCYLYVLLEAEALDLDLGTGTNPLMADAHQNGWPVCTGQHLAQAALVIWQTYVMYFVGNFQAGQMTILHVELFYVDINYIKMI